MAHRLETEPDHMNHESGMHNRETIDEDVCGNALLLLNIADTQAGRHPLSYYYYARQ